MSAYLSIIKQNWNQFLLVVKATALKQQISNFYPHIQRSDASDHIYTSHRPVVNVKAENIKIRDYPQKFIRTRQGKEGGGVGIWVHRKVKAVYLEKYVADNLEAVWAEVKVGRIRTVVRSVYIPPGDIDVLDT